MSNKNDLRVIKTNKVLFEALTNLMATTSFEQIKISDICNEAMINRSTFYAHYNDKYELVLALIDNIKESFSSDLQKYDKNVLDKKYFMELINVLINMADKNRELYSSILLHNQHGMLLDILIDIANKDLDQRAKIDSSLSKSIVPTEIKIKYYVNAVAGIGIDWIISKNKYTKEQLFDYLNELIPEKI